MSGSACALQAPLERVLSLSVTLPGSGEEVEVLEHARFAVQLPGQLAVVRPVSGQRFCFFSFSLRGGESCYPRGAALLSFCSVCCARGPAARACRHDSCSPAAPRPAPPAARRRGLRANRFIATHVLSACVGLIPSQPQKRMRQPGLASHRPEPLPSRLVQGDCYHGSATSTFLLEEGSSFFSAVGSEEEEGEKEDEGEGEEAAGAAASGGEGMAGGGGGGGAAGPASTAVQCLQAWRALRGQLGERGGAWDACMAPQWGYWARVLAQLTPAVAGGAPGAARLAEAVLGLLGEAAAPGRK